MTSIEDAIAHVRCSDADKARRAIAGAEVLELSSKNMFGTPIPCAFLWVDGARATLWKSGVTFYHAGHEQRAKLIADKVDGMDVQSGENRSIAAWGSPVAVGSSHTKRVERDYGVCPVCNMAMPATRVCC